MTLPPPLRQQFFTNIPKNPITITKTTNQISTRWICRKFKCRLSSRKCSKSPNLRVASIQWTALSSGAPGVDRNLCERSFAFREYKLELEMIFWIPSAIWADRRFAKVSRRIAAPEFSVRWDGSESFLNSARRSCGTACQMASWMLSRPPWVMISLTLGWAGKCIYYY